MFLLKIKTKIIFTTFNLSITTVVIDKLKVSILIVTVKIDIR